ncbi:unnamed protein product [Lepidochelys kempii]
MWGLCRVQPLLQAAGLPDTDFLSGSLPGSVELHNPTVLGLKEKEQKTRSKHKNEIQKGLLFMRQEDGFTLLIDKLELFGKDAPCLVWIYEEVFVCYQCKQ